VTFLRIAVSIVLTIDMPAKSTSTKWIPDWTLSEQADIVAAAQNGHKGAQEKIYRQFAKRVYNLIFRMVWHKDIAQELMQESFIDVFRGLSGFRGDVPLYAWIRKVSINRCLQHLRKKDESLSVDPDYLFELDSDNGQAANTQLAQYDVEKLLLRLTPKRRMIVWLFQIEGLTHKEIAESMNKSESFSKMEYSRALQDLRGFIEPVKNTSNQLLKSSAVSSVSAKLDEQTLAFDQQVIPLIEG